MPVHPPEMNRERMAATLHKTVAQTQAYVLSGFLTKTCVSDSQGCLRAPSDMAF